MVEIDVMYVSRWHDPSDYTVELLDGSVLVYEDPSVDVDTLAELTTEHKLSRWAEATDEDRRRLSESSNYADHIILIGKAEVPIGPDDVEQHSDGYGREAHPAINIKVYDTDLPSGDAWSELVNEFTLDPRLAALGLDELRERVEKALENDTSGCTWFDLACEQGVASLTEDAMELFGSAIDTWTEGRQGGWFVVKGLPSVEHWTPELLTKWHQLCEYAEGYVADVPREMAWLVLANWQDQLAERVHEVKVRFVLADADMDAGDPAEWDWHGKLGLSPDSKVTVTRIK